MIKPIKLAQKNFLSSLDISTEECAHILDLANNIKNNNLNLEYENKDGS